jgi:putative exosortase-associated protein (TIGR04073 family)
VLLSPFKICLIVERYLMKNLVVAALIVGLARSCFADIQDPPSNDYGPTRKLGRGLSNFFFAPAEIPVTIAKINRDEGNAAAASYGVVRGLGSAGTRHVTGFLEILL